MTPKQFSDTFNLLQLKVTEYQLNLSPDSDNVALVRIVGNSVEYTYHWVDWGNDDEKVPEKSWVSFEQLGIDFEQLLASSSSLEETIDNGAHPMGKT
jgi:hypothetical protein